ncbi:hypothetical protein LguiB_028818 [Lonicera macranthoides]
MGKATKWFRGLLGLNKTPLDSLPPSNKPPKQRRWSLVKSYRQKPHHSPPDLFSGDNGGVDPSKHTIAVAAATAAVADAAVKAAQAAAAVVKLTSSGRSTASGRNIIVSFGIREEFAAIKIQSNFRAYLSRRALRALKALVKLQALVRGHIVRKQTADMLRRMHALLRAQVRARSVRSQISESSQSSSKSSHFHHHHHHHPGPATPEKFEHSIRSKSTKNMLKRNGSKSYGPTDDEKSDKILEIDSGKHHFTQKRKNLFHSSHQASASDHNSQSLTTSKDQTIPSPSSYEVQSYFAPNDDEATSFCTAGNSPRLYSASSRTGSMRGGPFTPKSQDGSISCSLSGDHPSYMAYTESAKAKLRSLSAPRLRPRLERSSTRNSGQRVSFTSKAYPGSGRLDRLGMPMGGADAADFSGGYWSRF